MPGDYTPQDLERMADELLEAELRSKRSNKARLEEYPILSKYQLLRRRKREIPFSSLNVHDKLALGLRTDI